MQGDSSSEVGPGKPPVEHRFKPGVSGNPKGKAKGTKSLATLVRELEAEDFNWSLVPVKQKEAMQKIGSPWKAIMFSAVAKAVAGDTKAMEWLRKSGYGDKVLHEFDSGLFTAGVLKVELVQPKELEADGNVEAQPEATPSTPVT